LLYIVFGISYDDKCSYEMKRECNSTLASLYGPQAFIRSGKDGDHEKEFKNLFGDTVKKLAETIRIGIQVSIFDNELKKKMKKDELKLEEDLYKDIAKTVSGYIPLNKKKDKPNFVAPSVFDEKSFDDAPVNKIDIDDIIKREISNYIQAEKDAIISRDIDKFTEYENREEEEKKKDKKQGKRKREQEAINNYLLENNVLTYDEMKKLEADINDCLSRNRKLSTKIDKLRKSIDKKINKIKAIQLQYVGIWGSDSSKESFFPKKALVCNYNVISEKDNMEDALYHYSYAYDSKHETVRENEKIVSQSGNVKWMISRQGIACVYQKEEGKEVQFLDNGMRDRVDQVYLWIYIIVLHMYHGLQYYSTDFVEIYEEAIKKKKTYYESLCIVKEMEVKKKTSNSFYLQNFYTDISDISHQNNVFRKMYEIYNLDQMMTDFTENKELCSDYLKNLLDKKINSKISIIQYISGFTALYNPVKDITGMIKNMEGHNVPAVATIAALIVFIIVSVVKEVRGRYK